MAGTPTFIWIAPDRDQAPAKGPDHGRALCTDGAPSTERPAKAAGTRGDAGGSTEAPCQRGSWRAGVARCQADRVLLDPLAKAGFCERRTSSMSWSSEPVPHPGSERRPGRCVWSEDGPREASGCHSTCRRARPMAARSWPTPSNPRAESAHTHRRTRWCDRKGETAQMRVQFRRRGYSSSRDHLPSGVAQTELRPVREPWDPAWSWGFRRFR